MSNWEYVRLFGLGENQPSDSDISVIANQIKSIQDNTKNNIPAAYTYFGQFISHDLTHLGHGTREPVSTCKDLSRIALRRNPTLNLDSIYGGGLSDSQIPFDQASGAFCLGQDSAGGSNDLPREDSGRARIGDLRNDENLLIAQFQVLFMKLHNKLVQKHLSTGESDPETLFQNSRQEVIAIYQHLVLHDFAKRILPSPGVNRSGERRESVYDVIIKEGAGKLLPRDCPGLQISAELTGAAMRFGHSMVDTQYDLNFRNGDSGEKTRLLLQELFTHTSTHIDFQNPLPVENLIDWRFFVSLEKYLGNDAEKPNLARKIDLSINPYMLRIPGENAAPDSCPASPDIDIVERNIQRGRELGLKSGQEICQKLLQKHPDVANRLGLKPLSDDIGFFQSLKSAGSHAMTLHTPLWVYVLLEADIQQDSRLGALGGWIVADGLLAAAQQVDNTVPNGCTIEDLILGESGESLGKIRAGNDPVELADVVAFVYPDLVSRNHSTH